MILINSIFHIFHGFFNLLRFKLSKKYRAQQHLLFDKRLQTCEKCKYVNLSMRQCTKCGCFIDAKTKVIYKLDEDGYAISYIDPKTNDVYYACPKRYW
jgi:hypothetical protein